MTPLERAAKVIYEKINGQPGVRFIPDGPPFAWEELTPDSKRPFVDHARAVLTAIREPSEHMSSVGCHEYQQAEIGVVDELTQVHTWRCMIDAALDEG